MNTIPPCRSPWWMGILQSRYIKIYVCCLDAFSLHPFFVRYETHNLCEMNSKILFVSVAICLIIYGAHMNILCIIIIVTIPVLMKWSYRSPPPPIMLTIKSRMISVYWACNPITFRCISFWCMFLDTHLTTYHSNIGVHIRLSFHVCCLPLGSGGNKDKCRWNMVE